MGVDVMSMTLAEVWRAYDGPMAEAGAHGSAAAPQPAALTTRPAPAGPSRKM
jgi:hypothetical protein